MSTFDMDEAWELATKAIDAQEREFPKRIRWPEEPEKRSYWYGAFPTNRGPRNFIVRSEDKIPKGALEVLGPTESLEQAKCYSFIPPPTELPSSEDVVAGTVALHRDSYGEHFAVVLQIWNQSQAACVFLTSNPNSGRVNRSASKEEIALSGYVTTKKTYLASYVKDPDKMIATGKSFSEERISALYTEFFGDRSFNK